jgi:hypothetical protein
MAAITEYILTRREDQEVLVIGKENCVLPGAAGAAIEPRAPFAA